MQLPLSLFIVSSMITCVFGCQEDFERFVGYTLSERLATYVIATKSSQRSVGFLRDCHKSCQENPSCFAYAAHLQRLDCVQYSYLTGNDADLFRKYLTSDHDSMVFRKVCLLQVPPCGGYAWRYDVQPKMAMRLERVEYVHKVDSLAMCQILCSRETKFHCRSAVYNYVTKNCQISRSDRRTVPFDFFQSRAEQVYLENQCQPEGKFKQCDFSDQHGPAIALARNEEHADNLYECQQKCLGSVQFLCRSYTFNQATKRCLFGPDDMFVTQNLVQSSAKSMSFKQLSECVDVNVTCGKRQIQAQFRSNQMFDGKIVMMNSTTTACHFDVAQRYNFNVTIPIRGQSRCSIQPSQSNTVSTLIKLQYHDLVWTTKDRLYRLICHYSKREKEIENFIDVSAPAKLKPKIMTNTDHSNGRFKLPSAYMRIVDSSNRAVYEAKVGDELYIEIGLKGAHDVEREPFFVTNCVAQGRRTTVALSDKRGCPLNKTMMEKFALALNDQQKVVQKAKFTGVPLSSRLKINVYCDVNFCRDTCPEVNCHERSPDNDDSFKRKRRTERMEGMMMIQPSKITVNQSYVCVAEASETGGQKIGKPVLFVCLPVSIFLLSALAILIVKHYAKKRKISTEKNSAKQ